LLFALLLPRRLAQEVPGPGFLLQLVLAALVAMAAMAVMPSSWLVCGSFFFFCRASCALDFGT